MPQIFNHHAYHAAVRRNAAGANKLQESFFKKGLGQKGNRIVSRAVKKVAYRAADKQFGPGTSSFIKSITGKGDYILHSGRGIKSTPYRHKLGQKPSHTRHHKNLEKGEMRIQHSEYVGEMISGDVAVGTSGPSVFTSQLYGINPGNVGCFPWLATVAQNFQEYKFEKLIFEYKPLISESTSTSAATLTSMGTVCIGTQYDSSQGAYPNKQQLENSDYSVSAKPSEHMTMVVECDPKFNPLGVLYVSANTDPDSSGVSNADIRMQNLGLVQFASVNQPIADNNELDLGEIWVHYDITLFKPIQGYYGSILSGHWVGNAGTGAQATTTPFGPNVTAIVQPTQKSGSLLNCTFNSAGTITFPLAITQGSYLLVYSCNGGAATINASSFGNESSCDLVELWNGVNSSTDAPNNSIALVTDYMASCVININAPGAQLASIQLITTVIPAAGTYDLLITPYNDNIVS